MIFLSFSIVVLIAVTFVSDTLYSKGDSVQISPNVKIPVININTDSLVAEAQDGIIRINNYPVKSGYLSSRYGMRKDPIHGKRRMHTGIDIAARSGTKIYPMGAGKVIFSGRKAGYGKTIEIQHGHTVITRYSHLKKLLVKEGKQISKKDVIGLVGNTGRSTGPHLHLEVALNGKKVDPQIFLIGDIASR